jgi:hypothetical protein
MMIYTITYMKCKLIKYSKNNPNAYMKLRFFLKSDRLIKDEMIKYDYKCSKM